MTWPAVAALSRDTPVVIPTAAMEQHGHHLPVFTDTMLVGEITRRAEAQLRQRALFTPVLWLGNSFHHLDFPGTMSASPRVYLDTLVDVIENWITHGFRRIVLVNGHGGNNVPGDQAIFEVRQKHRTRDDLIVMFACYWALGCEPQKSDPSLEQAAMGHACEWETSMILALAPQLVGDYQKAEPVSPAGAVRSGTSRLDHQGSQPRGPHRQSARGVGRQGRKAARAVHPGRDQPAHPSDRSPRWPLALMAQPVYRRRPD